MPFVAQTLSRVPTSWVVLTLDFCGLTFGQGDCPATGTPCYNTYPTCKATGSYSKTAKDYEFVSAGCPLPFSEGERPYITEVSELPTEIKDNLTISARTKIQFADEPDTDVGIDPYVFERAEEAQGTFWKKLLARNPNYKGRYIRKYDGFFGETKSEFQLKFVGKVENIKIERGKATIEAVDLLKALNKIDVPPKLNIKLTGDIDNAVTSITLNDTEGLDSPSGHIRIGDEIIYYGAINFGTNVISSCTRGYFGTQADSHSARDKVQKVRYYAPANPFDILLEMLTSDAGYDADFIEAATFTDCKNWPGGEIEFESIVSEPVPLDKLFFEIVDILDCKTWVAENLKIIISKNIPNRGGRSYSDISDARHVVEGSAAVDLNEDSRITRVIFYWDKTVLGKIDEPTSYNRLDLAIDAEAESENEYGDVSEKKIFCRWIRTGYATEEALSDFVEGLLGRYVRHRRDATPIVSLEVETKDVGLRTGEFARLSTDELLNINGSEFDHEKFQIVRRERKENKVKLNLQKMPPRSAFIIAPDNTPAWADADWADKDYGFITGDNGRMPDDAMGYFIY